MCDRTDDTEERAAHRVPDPLPKQVLRRVDLLLEGRAGTGAAPAPPPRDKQEVRLEGDTAGRSGCRGGPPALQHSRLRGERARPELPPPPDYRRRRRREERGCGRRQLRRRQARQLMANPTPSRLFPIFTRRLDHPL